MQTHQSVLPLMNQWWIILEIQNSKLRHFFYQSRFEMFEHRERNLDQCSQSPGNNTTAPTCLESTSVLAFSVDACGTTTATIHKRAHIPECSDRSSECKNKLPSFDLFATSLPFLLLSLLVSQNCSTQLAILFVRATKTFGAARQSLHCFFNLFGSLLYLYVGLSTGLCCFLCLSGDCSVFDILENTCSERLSWLLRQLHCTVPRLPSIGLPSLQCSTCTKWIIRMPASRLVLVTGSLPPPPAQSIGGQAEHAQTCNRAFEAIVYFDPTIPPVLP